MAWLSRTSAAVRGFLQRAPLAVTLSGAMLSFGVQAAPAAAPNTDGRAGLENTVRYLQEAQNSDGGFGAGEGAPESDPDFSAWVALALASVGVNPQDQAKPGGTDLYSYLTAHAAELTSSTAGVTTTLERVLLVIDAAGTAPEDFGGVPVLQLLLARQLPSGAFPHVTGGDARINDTIFAILALSPVPGAGEAVRRAVDWLEAEQAGGAQPGSGGWPSSCPRTEGGKDCAGEAEAPNTEMTGAAIEALNAAGRHQTAAQTRALAYLHEAQNKEDGGWGVAVGDASNTDSSAWVTQGIWAAGGAPESPEWTTPSGRDPLAYMESEIQPNGSVAFEGKHEEAPVWNTAYVVPALAGRALPIAAVPRAVAPPPAPAATGAGVSAGGGGSGAPLFSRPQPQSHGHGRGGVRVLSSTSRRPPAAASVKAQAPAAAATTTAAAADTPAASGPTPDRARTASSEPEVSGLLLAASHGAARTNGAPGLRAAGDEASSALASALAVLIVALAAAGSQFERRRPQAVL